MGNTTTDIRRANLGLLIDSRCEGNQAEFARAIGKDKNQVSQWLGKGKPRNMGDGTARHIESKMQLPKGWMDTPQEAAGPISPDRVDKLEAEIRGLTGVLAILLYRLGLQQPTEAAVVAVELRRFLAKPGYSGEALPELLRGLETYLPSFGPPSQASREPSGK